MAIVKEEENFIYFRNAMISNYKPQINKPNIFHRPNVSHNNSNNYRPSYTPNYYNNNFQRSQFQNPRSFPNFSNFNNNFTRPQFQQQSNFSNFLKIITFLIFLLLAISINQDQLCLTIKVINQTFRDPRILVNSDLFSIITKCLVNNLGEVI